MWNANSDDGTMKKEGWESGIKQFKVKVPVGDYIEDVVADHMCENHNEWYEESCNDVSSDGEVWMYLNVNTKTGKITVVGAGQGESGHPIDRNLKLK